MAREKLAERGNTRLAGVVCRRVRVWISPRLGCEAVVKDAGGMIRGTNYSKARIVNGRSGERAKPAAGCCCWGSGVGVRTLSLLPGPLRVAEPAVEVERRGLKRSPGEYATLHFSGGESNAAVGLCLSYPERMS